MLVSNIGQTAASDIDLNSLLSRHGTAFSTGSNAGGYTLESVEIVLDETDPGDTITVTIRTDSSGNPGSTHATLTNPTLADGTNTFTAPSGTTLNASTTYWVHFQWTAGVLESGTTASNSEDSTPATDWSIANSGKLYSASWATLSNGRSLRIRVNGTAKSSGTNTAPTASNGEVETDENEDYTFAASDFNFSDTDAGDELESVKVTSIPGSDVGELKFDGTALTSSDLPKTVTKANLDDDKLVYDPPSDASGDDYANFIFKVNDGEDDSAASYVMYIDVHSIPNVTGVEVTSEPQAGTAGRGSRFR